MAKNNSTVDRIQAVWNKHGGESGIDHFLANKTRLVFIEPPDFPIWKTVKLGMQKSADDYLTAFKLAGIQHSTYGATDRMLARTVISQEEHEVDLVLLSVEDVGFKEGVNFGNIFTSPIERGLELCPAEVGLALRLQYRNQLPKNNLHGDKLRVAMEPIESGAGHGDAYTVVSESSGLWLGSYETSPYQFWGGKERFIFVKPRKKH